MMCSKKALVGTGGFEPGALNPGLSTRGFQPIMIYNLGYNL